MKKRLLSLFLAAALCLVPVNVSAGDLLYGDANNDGSINTKDVLTERMYLADVNVDISLTLGDCNGDDVVNTKDVLILRQYLAELIDAIEGKTPVVAKKSLRSIYRYDENGENFEINFYTYNNKGKLTLMTDRQPDGTLNWKKEFSYDVKNREILCVHTEDDERTIMTATAYDAAGHVSAITKTDGDGTVLRKMTYRYDKAGNRIEEDSLDDEGNVDGKTVYAYDASNRLTREETFNADGVSYGFVTYGYNDKGYTASIERYGAEGTLVGSEEFVYDASDNLKSHVYNDELGRLDARMDYTYAATGKLAQTVPYNFDGEANEWKYCYAQKKMPISAICYSWDGKTVLGTQQYTYIDAVT